MENSSVIYDSKRGLHEPTVRRDWFPLVRLITVAAVILLGLHLIPSWQAAVGDVSALPVRLLEGFITIALVSFVLAQVYLVLAVIPVVVVVYLNQWC